MSVGMTSSGRSGHQATKLRRLHVGTTSWGQLPIARVLPYLPTPLALALFWWLDREELISPRPYWQIVAMLAGCGIANVLALLKTRDASPSVRINVRAAVAAISTTVIIYATGWGSMIIIGYALGIADIIHSDGERAWLPASIWTSAGVLCGQIAIGLGIAPTMLPVAVGNAVALGNLICVVVVLRMFAVAAQAARVAQDELRRQANTDALTGLPNRASITEQLETALAHRHAAVMFVDLDGFKEVNDRLGHERGDAVLVEAASRIATSLGVSGTVGRLGGDEFLVVLPALSGRELVAIADRILLSLREPWTQGGAISASIGIATALPHETADHVLDRADHALSDAKSDGRARWRAAV
jgi:diguanylate cyclase (GGDEF)-like protein